MTQYRTAQGRSVDMSRLIAKNEKTRAVGNMKVNARGDVIDGHGKIVQSVNERSSERYASTVGNSAARPVNTRVQPQPDRQPAPAPTVVPEEEKLPIEEEFDSQDDVEIEQIKQQETKQQETKKGKK